jgi:[ribosomal protein S5]-alanine N-acetyltransferase
MHATATAAAPTTVMTATDWRTGLPVLRAGAATLRQLHASDAPSLFAMLASEEVNRFISPPPTTVAGFERFIAWTLSEQAAGRYVCFGIVPDGCDAAAGIIQVRQLEPSFGTAEWGFALGSSFWGTGIFQAAASAVMGFVFETVGVHRLEARAAVANGRGNAALRKLGAVPEGVLRRSFLRNGQYLDQVLWGIVAPEWAQLRLATGPRVH